MNLYSCHSVHLACQFQIFISPLPINHPEKSHPFTSQSVFISFAYVPPISQSTSSIAISTCSPQWRHQLISVISPASDSSSHPYTTSIFYTNPLTFLQSYSIQEWLFSDISTWNILFQLKGWKEHNVLLQEIKSCLQCHIFESTVANRSWCYTEG